MTKKYSKNEKLAIIMSYIFFPLGIISIISSFFVPVVQHTNDSKDDCKSNTTKEGADCKIFDTRMSECLKGKIKNKSCVKDTNFLSLILLILGFSITIIACSIVGYFMNDNFRLAGDTINLIFFLILIWL